MPPASVQAGYQREREKDLQAGQTEKWFGREKILYMLDKAAFMERKMETEGTSSDLWSWFKLRFLVAGLL